MPSKKPKVHIVPTDDIVLIKKSVNGKQYALGWQSDWMKKWNTVAGSNNLVAIIRLKSFKNQNVKPC